MNFMHAYFGQRQQKTKLDSTFSELMSILFGVPQGSILRPLSFIIYICDLFILNDGLVCGSYADDTTPFVYWQNSEEILGELENQMAKTSEYFLLIFLKANGQHFHLFLILFVDKVTNIENFIIKLSYSEVLLGVTFDSNLRFSEHVTCLCATANRKLYALTRVCKYISLKKCPILMKSPIISKFSYYPLT